MHFESVEEVLIYYKKVELEYRRKAELEVLALGWPSYEAYAAHITAKHAASEERYQKEQDAKAAELGITRRELNKTNSLYNITPTPPECACHGE